MWALSAALCTSGHGVRLATAQPPLRAHSVMSSYDRPSCPELPRGTSDVDLLTEDIIRKLDVGELQSVVANLEVAIFDSPPFDKVNEMDRRRKLALALFLQNDPALHPALIPNAKEVLRQKKGADAEMQYVLGAAMRSCMEGKSSQLMALHCFEKALELQPEYPEAGEALEEARAAIMLLAL
eukprot:CAMPEP_0119375174 /NCGR_PEP_ID=MMETSP1334-20130426/34137_1 /TAXON_ID=127549 /ORGANISM="Calcidiscus leptoporus, Strain RCC1130" /LENGTH=181 /DNA_ID=CAMNT_0007393411 /DNA_START=15 /DNA_END=560 /DNA_ORIENTATION=+